ncbi:type II secretion system GspH family protein [Sulfurovum sp. XGS-02]|uniref:type II secretion system protein n=1 Tax=Sulfurovum sp. XGS-02 TaxID=2925411 RepID=UPI00205A5DEF|nr:type II secretion system protein [Sulfurovum sp. XGS-02]UPT77308.1 type II secretion system GspH family protein [Sulfurovum sp. XGS-02]
MFHKHQKAFTMIELIFVIVVIGILSAIAIPKFAATRGDAEIAKAKATVGSVRSAVAAERQKRILRGVFTPITSLSSNAGYDKPIFDGINGDTNSPVLEFPLQSCKDNTAQGCWYTADNVTYTYKLPVSGGVDFNLSSSRFSCKLPNSDNCKLLTQ